MKYPVFVFGISDSCGKFFPIVYFCTSQRTGTDIEWCCAFLKRVLWETFVVQFSPQFIMTDADNAQFNACVAQLPHSKILMCWFHVCQNVKARIEKAALAPVTIAMIWRDLNNLHYSHRGRIPAKTIEGARCMGVCVRFLSSLQGRSRLYHRAVDPPSSILLLVSVSHPTRVCYHEQSA